MDEEHEAALKVSLRNAGPPVIELWAWVVIDSHGQEAICRSPVSVSAPMVSPDRKMIEGFGAWCAEFYHPLKVEFRRYILLREEATVEVDGLAALRAFNAAAREHFPRDPE